MHPVVSSCHLAIIGQPLLGAIELLWADDGGHRCDRDPLGWVRDPLGPLTASQRQQGGAAPLGGMRAEAIGKDLTEVDGIGEHASQGRGAPGPVTPGRRNAQPLQPLDQGEDRRTSSSGGDLHPSALSEPDVRLSPHPAPTLQPPARNRKRLCLRHRLLPRWLAGLLGRSVGSLPSTGVTRLRRYYEPVRPCASHRYSAPQGSAPWRSPLASRRQVPTFRTRASRWSHAVFMPVAARPVGRLPPSFVAGQQREPGFGDVPTLSTRQQRFTHVRLTSAHLTGLLPPFAATLTTSAIGPRQLAVVWTLILQSEPEGPTLISCAARLPGVDRYMIPSSRRRGAP